MSRIVVLVASTKEEVGDYEKAYPGLLVGLHKLILPGDYSYQGLRITRAFITETVDPRSGVVYGVQSALALGLECDEHPIWLRLSHQRYGWDYEELLRKYLLFTHEEGEVVWTPAELAELKRIGDRG